MAMSRKLPLFDEIARANASTIERARQTLGGSGSTDARAGRIVRDEAGVVGIVLYASEDEMHVLVGASGTVSRSKSSAWVDHDIAPPDLAAMTNDVLVFAHLESGARVGFRDRTGDHDGLLFEKCRYGALVARDDRSIVAIGFRNLWPVTSDAAPSVARSVAFSDSTRAKNAK
ncbi:hypothetical protein BH09MYX1_BH09MYX1_44950 [soil metagenome]